MQGFEGTPARRRRQGRRALLAPWAALAVACATAPPPLEPPLAAMVTRALAIDAQAADLEQVDARLQHEGQRSAFASYFSGRHPVLIDEAARTAGGADARRGYYYDRGQLFYVREVVTPPAGSGDVELQLFLESGRVVGSRKIAGGRLAEVTGDETAALTRHAAALRTAAERKRGPAYKIELDLRRFDELGLVGPPLRAVRYAFCTPSGERYAAEVRGIDPSAERDESGGCAAGKTRWAGNTHQPAFRRVLLKLAGLPYVESIREAPPRAKP